MKRTWTTHARKLASLLLGTALLASMLTGCGGNDASSDDSGAAEGGTTIRMIGDGTDEQAAGEGLVKLVNAGFSE